jgi:hypothetical protein
MSRRIIVLLVLCAGLALALWVDSGGVALEQPRFSLPAFEAVRSFEVHRTGQASVHVQRTATGWQVLPEKTPADGHALAEIARVLATPLAMDQRSQRVGDGSRYGLGEHALRVVLQHPGGAIDLAIGKVVDGRRTFIEPAQGPSGTVYRAQANLRRLFDRPPHTWRERRLFAHVFSDINTLRRKDGSRLTWSLQRESPQTAWRLAQPAGAEVAQQAADAVINSLITAKVERYEAAEQPFEARTTLEAQTFSGETFGLEISGAPGEALRVRRLGDASVGQLPAWFGAFLDVRVADLRERSLLTLQPEQVQAVITERQRPISIERLPDGAWRMRAPEQIPVLNQDKVEAFLKQLANIQANGFVQAVPDDAFVSPWGVLRIRLNDARTLRMEVGARYGASARFVRIDQQPATGAVISTATLAGLFVGPPALK